MKKYLFTAFAILMVLLAASCRNYIVVPAPSPGGGGGGGSSSASEIYDVSNYSELVAAVNTAKNGDRIRFEEGFSVPTTAEAVDITKNLTFSGKIGIVGEGSTASIMATAANAEPKAGGTFTLFNVMSGRLSLSGLPLRSIKAQRRQSPR